MKYARRAMSSDVMTAAFAGVARLVFAIIYNVGLEIALGVPGHGWVARGRTSADRMRLAKIVNQEIRFRRNYFRRARARVSPNGLPTPPSREFAINPRIRDAARGET